MNKEILAKNPIFSELDEAEFNQALNLFSAVRQEYTKNSIILHAGEQMPRFGVVLSGIVQVSFTDIDGNEVLMASAVSGDAFGESLCWLKTQEVPVTITAFTDVMLLWLSPESLRSGDASPLLAKLRNRFISMLAEKALSMNERVQILSKPTIRLRLVTFFSQCAAKYGGKTFSVPFDRESLARYIGVNRASLSRELSAMQDEGVIEFYKNSFKILK